MALTTLLFGADILDKFTGEKMSGFIKKKLGIDFENQEDKLLLEDLNVKKDLAKLSFDTELLKQRFQERMTMGLLGRVDERFAKQYGLEKEALEFNQWLEEGKLRLSEKQIDTEAQLGRESLGVERELGMAGLETQQEANRLGAIASMPGPNLYAQTQHMTSFNPEFPIMSSMLTAADQYGVPGLGRQGGY
jgi:hypothetical protein